jgi:hypothetical protein
MFQIVAQTLVYGSLVALVAIVIGSWVSWLRSNGKCTKPFWRNAIALCGFVGCTFSAFLLAALAIHSLVTGGFPFYHPTLMLAFRLGFLTSSLGLLAGCFGKGPLQIPSLCCSAFAFLMWVIQGITQ